MSLVTHLSLLTNVMQYLLCQSAGLAMDQPLLEKGPWVWAGNPLLVSFRLADTIYRIRKIRHFWYRLLPANTNNYYWYRLS
jgi:hypothetical protein